MPTPNAGAAKQGSQQIRLSWSGGGTNGRPLDHLEIRVDGGGWENVGTASGSRVVGNGYNQTHSIQVRAFDTAGQVSGITSASATTDAPAAAVTVSRGSSAVGQPNCSHSSCAYIKVDLTNFAPNTTVTCNAINTSTGPIPGSFTVSTDGSGRGSRQSSAYFGYPTGRVEVTCGGVTGRRDPWV